MGYQVQMLLQVDPGRSQEAHRYVSALPTVTDAALTSGPYDVIATVEAGSDELLGRTVAQARQTPGLCLLQLCRPS